jgi:hypothetical protein
LRLLIDGWRVSKSYTRQQPDCRDADFFARTSSRGGGGQGVANPSHKTTMQSLEKNVSCKRLRDGSGRYLGGDTAAGEAASVAQAALSVRLMETHMSTKEAACPWMQKHRPVLPVARFCCQLLRTIFYSKRNARLFRVALSSYPRDGRQQPAHRRKLEAANALFQMENSNNIHNEN